MKNYYLLILTVILTSTASAQVPNYFGNSPSWVVGFYYAAGLPDPGATAYNDLTRIYAAEEEVIGEYTYTVLRKRNERMYDTGMEEDPVISTGIEMKVRQEGRSIYYYHEASGQDSLLISYDLEVGDVFTGNFGHHVGTTDTIRAIDSVLVGDTYRRRLIIDEEGAYNFVIEGIATITGGGACGYYFGGQFIGYCGIGFDYLFYCYGEHSISLYGDTDCALTLGVEESVASIETLLYPNPANEQFQIQSNEEIAAVHVYSMDGKELLYTGVNAQISTIDISGIAKGNYVVKVDYSNGEIDHYSLIKE